MQPSFDPVRDIERHMAETENRKHIYCDHCGGAIYAGDEDHYGDVYYLLNGLSICDACVRDYLAEIRKEYES